MTNLISVKLPSDSWVHVLKALEIAAQVKASESRDVAETVIRGTRHAIQSQIDRCQKSDRLTRAKTAELLAAHYSHKLNGMVRCDFDTRRRKYCIAGEGLPPHPDLQAQYPNGWSMLDYVSPAEARRLVGGSK